MNEESFWNEVFERIGEGGSLRGGARDHGIAYATLHDRVYTNKKHKRHNLNCRNLRLPPPPPLLFSCCTPTQTKFLVPRTVTDLEDEESKCLLLSCQSDALRIQLRPTLSTDNFEALKTHRRS